MANGCTHNVAEKRVESFEDLLRVVREIRGQAPGAEWWFRGEPSHRYCLRSKLWRTVFKNDLGPATAAGIERGATESFRLRAMSRSPNLPAYQDQTAWLCFMQHHGLPTRLLDWTASLPAALWFAVGDAPVARRPLQLRQATIWVLNPWSLNAALAGAELMFSLAALEGDPIIAEAFLPNTSTKDWPEPQARAVTGAEVTTRQLVQASRFTIQNTPHPLCQLAAGASWLTRLVIAPQGVTDAQDVCRILGATRSSLFPDLDALAKEISLHI